MWLGLYFLAPEPRSPPVADRACDGALKDTGTFAALYARLTGDAVSNGLPKFSAAIRALPHGITNDDPFAGVTPTPPPPTPSTTAQQLALLVMNAALDDLAAGKSEPIMKADIEAILKAN
jgi:hypothetical protein